ncbi:MAG: tetratricopeptide repeat protein [Anaerolineae bacterium]|nr:tetratricopeptide repeat protein [Anaerolineae bacterium]
MQLTFLGRPEIWVDGRLLAQRLPLKGVALLAYLAATGRPVTREVLAGLLWGETPDAAARASLRVTLNRLPALLRPYLHLSRDTVGLHLNRVSADVQVLATAVSGAPADWATAVALYRGDFLEGFNLPDAPAFEEWALLERERLRLLVIELLHRLADDALAQQAYTAGIAYARRSLALDNWREEAHRLLMRLLALDGRRSDALAQFESCRRLLAENLGVEPTAETVALYEAIKHNRLAALPTSTLLSASPHPLTTSSLPPHNLPAIAASFVGREAELAQLIDLLAQADGRLLTILGPGGVGKTRLALETATRLLAADPHFADGVFFVPLADLPPDSSALNEAEAALAAHVANALGLALNGAAPPDEQLRQHLRDRRCLLILDNFEHLLPQADLVAGLLAAAPGLRLLVTSRQRLNLYEEWLVELDGLELPPNLPSASLSANEGAALADWQNFSAPQLFIQRARRVYLGFNSAAERGAILHICRLVGGLPLALELAAAWVRTVPCRDIAAAIERHLDFLTGDLRNMPERQRSLRAAFAYSWELLPAAEQIILARLAVFRGGFDGQAALAITGEAATGRSLRQLSALVDKSLVQRQPDGRYRLHEVIRLFAQEQLDADEWAAVRMAHARYYAALLAAQGAKSAGPEAEAALRLMALELENGRFAWQWALSGEPTAAPLLAQLLAPLSLFYLRRGRSLEAAAWLEEAMPVVERDAQASLAAQVAHQLAKHEEALGRYDAAQARLLACLPALEVADLTAQAADAWEMLGRTQRHLGDLAAAETSFQRSLGLHRLTGQQSSIAGVLNSLGVLAKNDGRYAEARACYTESLDIFRRQGDRSGVAVCLINLGNIANVQGDYGRARACYQESYDLAVAAENRSQMAINLLNLGSVARATGDVVAAGRYYRESLALGREMGRALIVAAALDGLGLTQLLAGDLGAARATLREGLTIAVDLNSTGMILTLLASAGRALAQVGQPDGARLLAFVWQQPGAPHHVREEAAAYAANAGLELAQPATDLDIGQAVQVTLAQLRE